jgi:ribose transport system substrate-binding protein
MPTENDPGLRPRRARGRWIVVSALLLVCAALVACGESASESGGDDNGDAKQANLAPGKEGSRDDFVSIKQFCPDKEMTVAYADGFGGNGWRKIVRREFESELAQCPNVKTLYTDGQGDPQKAISNVQGLIAQGVDAIVTFPDAGPAMLPVYRQAVRAGIPVVPWAVGTSFPGEPGKDWTVVETENSEYSGKVYGEWLAKALDGKGNYIILGGQPGSPTAKAIFEGAKKALEEFPDMKLLVDRNIDTNYDEAFTQKAVAGVLAKYPDIDGVISGCGNCLPGAISAFQQANRKLPAFTGDDNNGLGCDFQRLKPSNPSLELANTSGRTWLVRAATRKALAAAQGMDDTEPSVVNLEIVEDSLNPDLPIQCDKSLSPGAVLSTDVPRDQLKELLG